MKKKILIYSSIGGGGHESARKAITAYLKPEYTILYEHMFDTTLASMDPIQYITLKRHSGVRMYNFFIRKKFFKLINLSYFLGRKYFYLLSEKIKKHITNSLHKHKPDFVISIIPIVNNSILAATRKLNIPLIIIPTDLDARTFIFNLKKPYPKKFIFTQAFKNNGIDKTIQHAAIPENQRCVTGFPIRPEFFTPKNKDEIKKRYNLSNDKPVVLLLMGAAGSQASLDYAQYLSKVTQPMHLIIVLGYNEQLRPEIEEITFPNHVAITIFGFIEEIADLMAASDLCITKSGSVSVCETIYSNLPVLLDATSDVLRWEQFNHRFIKQHGFGTNIQKYKNIPKIVMRYISDQEKLNQIKTNIQNFEKKNFEVEIKKVIADLLKE